MVKDGKILIGKDTSEVYLYPRMANRHGLIAGATGTGKTITMKVLAEDFSRLGVPVFLCDVKGDVSGIAEPGVNSEKLQQRIQSFGLTDFAFQGYPAIFWDVFGQKGTPVRIAVSSLGALNIARILDLTETQLGVLEIAFRYADDNALFLYDFKDLDALLSFMEDHINEVSANYGHATKQSVGVVRRSLLRLQDEGADFFFGTPQLDIADWFRVDQYGRGFISVLNCEQLVQRPNLYATFLFWMLSELYERLPEAGDLDKPKMVFFFDEAHMMFDTKNKAFTEKMEQICRLIRSKGVGIYFVTQNPADIPSDVLSQVGNRIQHALHAYTPAEQKGVKAAAQAFRVNPNFKTEEVISELGVGQALVSCLDESGVPTVVEKVNILPPQSKMAPVDETIRSKFMAANPMEQKYRNATDPESAYEIIMAAREEIAAAQAEEAAAKEQARIDAAAAKEQAKLDAAKAKEAERKEKEKLRTRQNAANAAASTVSTAVTRNMVNSVLGGKQTSGSTIAKRAATNAATSVVRSETRGFVRGLFGNKR